MEPKKISFGFSKIKKKPDLLATAQKPENKVDLIKCLEGQSIKLVEEKSIEKEELLVIPLKEATRTAAAFASLRARHNVLNDVSDQQEPTDKLNEVAPKTENRENETIEQKAARELLESINNKNEENDTNGQSTITIPKPDELPLDGAIESSINDYENIPISKFGFAMLRGMGWKDETKSKDKKDTMEPIVRPKGMGLGADKILRQKAALIPPDANETLEIKKNAFVRILAGKHKDLYAQIEGFDDHAGRVIVKLALGGNYESLNEFMVQPVSKKEYAQYSKVINSAKYEEYKKLENAQGQIILKQPKSENAINKMEDCKTIVKQESNSSRQNSSNIKHEDDNSERRSDHHSNRKQQKDSHDERRRSRSKSTSSRSSEYNHRISKKKSKSKKHKNKSHGRHRYKYSSSDDEKRHKKKTKKSKRPRSRSGDRRT